MAPQISLFGGMLTCPLRVGAGPIGDHALAKTVDGTSGSAGVVGGSVSAGGTKSTSVGGEKSGGGRS